ncbi:MAG: transposase, partial [Planctomycetota bacterium]
MRGGTYFFTLVTYRRERFLVENDSRRSLGDAIRQVRTTHPFEIPAIVLLPDHLHFAGDLATG